MRRALAAAAVLAAVGCKQQEPAAPAPSTDPAADWVQKSSDGRFEIRQRRETSGCRVQAVVKSPDGERSLWTSQTCLPTPSGLVFLSANGERLLVLDLFPSSQAAQTADWSKVPLASVWARGAVVRQYTGAELLTRERVTDMGKVLSWVRGDSYDDVHKAARASPDGQSVTVDLVDGRTLALGFEGNPLPAPEPAAAEPARKVNAVAAPALDVRPAAGEPLPQAQRPQDRLAGDEQGLYRWEDEQGELHFGVGAQVPPQYRKRARPVDAAVGVVPMDSPSAASMQAGGPAPGGPAPGGTPRAGPAPAPGGPAPAAPAVQPQDAAPAPASPLLAP